MMYRVAVAFHGRIWRSIIIREGVVDQDHKRLLLAGTMGKE